MCYYNFTASNFVISSVCVKNYELFYILLWICSSVQEKSIPHHYSSWIDANSFIFIGFRCLDLFWPSTLDLVISCFSNTQCTIFQGQGHSSLCWRFLMRLEKHAYACPRNHIDPLELRWRPTTPDVFYKMSQITLMSPCKLNARCKSWVNHIDLLYISGEPMYPSIHIIHISSLKLTWAASSHGCTIVSS